MTEVPAQSQPTSQGINWKRIIIGVVIGIILVGGGILGFYLYQKNSEGSTPQQVNTPITASPSSKPSNETANWNTYTNTKYSYQIKYPSNWSVGAWPSNNTNLGTADYLTFIKITGQSLFAPNQVIFNISFYPNSSNIPLKDFLQTGDINIYSPAIFEFPTLENELARRKLTVDGMTKANFQDFEALSEGKTRLYVNTGENIILFYIEADTDSADSTENLFNQLLTTFKFLE